MDGAIDHELRSAALELLYFMKLHGTIYDDDEVWHAFEDVLRCADIAQDVQAQTRAAKWDAVHRECRTRK